MDTYEQGKYVGSMQQLAYIRPICWQEGRVRGLHGYDICNGPLHFQVMADKCLDIGNFSYKGINMSFLSKTGLTGRMDYDTHGEEGRKSLMGGMMFTCGLENTCLPCEDQEGCYPMHGRIRSTPAEECGYESNWVNGNYNLSVKGVMRESEIFGKNLTLKRTIKTAYGEGVVRITDEITNHAYREEPLMLLYHINAGYPFLDENLEVVLPTKKVTPRDRDAEKDKEHWMKMDKPVDEEPERVYLHELYSNEQGDTFAAFVNWKKELAFVIDFNKKYLSRFVQWKSLASGDYVMGLEPTNSDVYGRVYEKENIHKIKPGETEIIQIKFTVLEGVSALNQLMNRCNALKMSGK